VIWSERLGQRPVLTAAAGAMVIGFSAILVSLADVTPETAAVFRCAYALPALAALAWWERRRFGPRPARERRLGLVAGVLFAADLISWHHAIHDVGAGLGTVLANLQVVVVAFVAWALLGEHPGRRVLVAAPVTVAGAVLISGLLETGAYGDDPARGTAFGVATTLAYSGFLLVLRFNNADIRRPAGPLLDATASATVVAAVAAAAYGALDLSPSWPAHGWLALLAISSQVTGWLLISVSLPRLPAATTSIVLLVQPVSSVALGALLLGERPSPLQTTGVVVILAGVVYATARRGRSPDVVAAPVAGGPSPGP
jgi:drug/metabolite transporter (DMT)-like permease